MWVMTDREPFYFKEFFAKSLLASAFSAVFVLVKPLAVNGLHFSDMWDEYLIHMTASLTLFMWVWMAFKNADHGLEFRGPWVKAVKEKYMPFWLAGFFVGLFVGNYVLEIANGALLASGLLVIYGGQYRRGKNLNSYTLSEWALSELIMCRDDLMATGKYKRSLLLKYIQDEIERRRMEEKKQETPKRGSQD